MPESIHSFSESCLWNLLWYLLMPDLSHKVECIVTRDLILLLTRAVFEKRCRNLCDRVEIPAVLFFFSEAEKQRVPSDKQSALPPARVHAVLCLQCCVCSVVYAVLCLQCCVCSVVFVSLQLETALCSPKPSTRRPSRSSTGSETNSPVRSAPSPSPTAKKSQVAERLGNKASNRARNQKVAGSISRRAT